ncbi:MAG TPA: nuclear transport factor 2 family protein [Terriglobales bacterium]
MDELHTEDGVFYDPSKGAFRGRDEIDRIEGTIRATHPDFQYQPIAQLEEWGDGGRVQWVSGRRGEAPAYAGTDFIVALDGRIAAVYFFLQATSVAGLCHATSHVTSVTHVTIEATHITIESGSRLTY